jgi:uncharacterized protein DUF3667/uncharacterized protein DUF4286
VPANLIYEVECQLDPDIVPDYDAWLPGHVREVLACAGFLGATIETTETPPGERQRRRVRYRVESVAALDHYLENEATRLRTLTSERFGGRVQCERRIFKPREDVVSVALGPRRCLNCGSPIAGAHCAACGQASDVHVLSMREVAGDITHSLLHLDSRIWRTLRLLILKPGELTREFIAGRHQTYLPPFRLYLGISILFFALTALLPDASLVRTDAKGAAVIAPVTVNDPRATKELQDDVRKELEAAGVDPEVIGQVAAGAKPCTADIPPVFGMEVEGPILRACERIRADGGAALADRFASTAPKLMFVFLPLMAAVALLFYWRPRRLYAEHLVLFLHNHAFTFLLIGVMEIASAMAAIKLPLMGLFGFVNFLLLLYLPWYIFRSMRVVYGEGRLRTSFKFFMLVTIYFTLLGITIMAGLVYSVLSL